MEELKKELEEAIEKANKKFEEDTNIYVKPYWLLDDDGNIIYSVNLNDSRDNSRKVNQRK